MGYSIVLTFQHFKQSILNSLNFRYFESRVLQISTTVEKFLSLFFSH